MSQLFASGGQSIGAGSLLTITVKLLIFLLLRRHVWTKQACGSEREAGHP